MSKLRWRLRALWMGLTIKPMRGGAPEGGEGGEGSEGGGSGEGGSGEGGSGGEPAGEGKEGGGEPSGEGKDEPEPSGEGKEPPKTAEEYRQELRRTERRAKRSGESKDKEIADLRRQLKEREDADKSEQEKAIEKAREEARAEERESAEKSRRQDRLEAAATRLAAKGIEIEVKDGDETVKKTIKFADPEDALVHLERSISRGDIEADSVFNEQGRIKDDSLSELLAELLESKPHLREAGEQKPEPKPPGDADAGKGSGDGAKDLEDMSVQEHFDRITGGAFKDK